MDALKEYVIPVAILNPGEHHFEFIVDWHFFREFKDAPVDQGRFEVHVTFDKQQDHWQVHFSIQGILDTSCDRCLAPIGLPVEGNHWLIVKFDEDVNDEADVVYVSRDERIWNISQFIYEFVLLSIPVTHRYDCDEDQNPPCDLEVLKRLDRDEDTPKTNPMWDALRQFEKKP